MNTLSHKKIIITGGHVTPAVSVIDELMRRHPDWELIFVGRKVALEGSSVLSEEYRMITEKRIRFLPITTGRLKRDGGVGAFISLLKVPVGFAQASMYVLSERPDAVMSFGGYIALPVVCMSYLAGVPVVTHEQTRRPGLANRIISKFAHKTCVSFADADSKSGLGNKSIVTGLPLRASVFAPPHTAPSYLSHITKPILFIMGGSTGAVSLNDIVYKSLPQLLSTYTIVHQVGRISYEKAFAIKNNLNDLKKEYIPVPFLTEQEYSWVLHHATIIVGRSGANSVMEIATIGKVALFVPLPWAAGNEQYYNAKFLQDAGSADILLQADLTPESLVQKITSLFKEKSKREKIAKRLSLTLPQDGAKKLADVLDTVLVV